MFVVAEAWLKLFRSPYLGYEMTADSVFSQNLFLCMSEIDKEASKVLQTDSK